MEPTGMQSGSECPVAVSPVVFIMLGVDSTLKSKTPSPLFCLAQHSVPCARPLCFSPKTSGMLSGMPDAIFFHLTKEFTLFELNK